MCWNILYSYYQWPETHFPFLKSEVANKGVILERFQLTQSKHSKVLYRLSKRLTDKSLL